MCGSTKVRHKGHRRSASQAIRRYRATAELLAQSPRWECEERRSREGPRRSPGPYIDPANVPHLDRSQSEGLCAAKRRRRAIEEEHAAPQKARGFIPGGFISSFKKKLPMLLIGSRLRQIFKKWHRGLNVVLQAFETSTQTTKTRTTKVGGRTEIFHISM